MSVAAMAWAFRQKIPAKPKILLLALADQTDDVTGRVCYGKTDIKHLAKKSSLPERSIYRYVAALVRNGYAIRESGKDKGQESQFWLCLDRPPADIDDWQWNIIPSGENLEPDDQDDDAQDIGEGMPPWQTPHDTGRDASDAQDGRPPLPIGGRPRVSRRHQDITDDSLREQGSGFSREAQDLEREAVSIQRAAQAQNVRKFVIYASRAWDAWVEHRRRNGITPATMHTCNGTGEFAGKRGWYMPSLFPPSHSGTDPPEELSDEDARELAKL